MKIKLKHIHKVKVRGKVYYYHRKTRQRFTAEPGTLAFMQEYQAFEALRHHSPAISKSLGKLAAAYRASPEFTALAPRTRADYAKVMDWLKPLDAMPLAQLSPVAVVGIRDKAMAQRRLRFANYVLQVLSLLCAWGRPRGWLRDNPAQGIPKIKPPKDAKQANRAWTAGEREKVLAAVSSSIRPIVALGMFAALREGDAVRFVWSSYNGQAIAIRQGKTGTPLWIPTHRRLREILDATPRLSPVVATHSGGKPYTANGFRSSFFTTIRALGLDVTFHGLRHTVAEQLAEAGCDEQTIAAVLGHSSTRMAAHYARRADRNRRATDAIAKLEKL
jgi:integrase